MFAQPYFGVLLTIAAYWAGMKIQHKTRLAICNGMLLAVLLVIAVLLVFHIPYESYYQGGALINLFLGPATACMAVTIYSQRRLLAKHWLPVLVGCTVGVVTAMGSILLLCRLFGLDRAMTMSLLPKSVTMPIATVVSQGHGGTMAITVAAVVVTGMLGNLCAPLLVKLFRVKDPMAVGLGMSLSIVCGMRISPEMASIGQLRLHLPQPLHSSGLMTRRRLRPLQIGQWWSTTWRR